MTEPTPGNSGLLKVITSAGFIEKILLLLVTALISGLIIPFIADNIQLRVAHQQRILDNQSALYDELSSTIITIETLILDVSWNNAYAEVKNKKQHEKALERYSEQIPFLLSKLRAGTLKANNLASEEVSNKLFEFQKELLSKQDLDLNKLESSAKATTEEWLACHKYNVSMLYKANELLSELAVDFGIVRQK